jgi:hypothetical protein
MSFNTLQDAAVKTLVSAFLTVRNMVVIAKQIDNASVTTVSSYVINPLSATIRLYSPAVPAHDGQPEVPETELAEFPAIEVRKTGKFALPTIRSYKESAGANALLPYPLGQTAFDAALFADSHVRKQGGAWLRRAPQAATAIIAASVPAPAPAPVGVSSETGKDTAKLTQEIQGKRK